MPRYRVIDTNVAVAANGRNTHADTKCQLNCVKHLRDALERDIIIIDSLDLILSEYKKKLRANGDPGVGDAFYRHVVDNKHNPEKCLIVPLTIDAITGEIDQFPRDVGLGQFDLDDRKFVAVAIASNVESTILNAVDTDWCDFSAELSALGLQILQLCPQHMQT